MHSLVDSGQLICFIRATGPACPVGDAVGINGIAAQLGGCVIGTECGQSCESAEPGQDKIWGVPAQLVGVLLTRVVHAVAAAAVVITDEPAISLEFEVTFASIFTEFTGGVTLVTCVMGVAITILVQLEYALVT